MLDIGAGPTWSWTDLALKMTEDSSMSHFVISNDLGDMDQNKQNNIFVRGDFLEEQVRTKIAMNLMERRLDTILLDATPNYSGNINTDGQYTMEIFANAIQFAAPYLRKGGTFIMRTVDCPAASSNLVTMY